MNRITATIEKIDIYDGISIIGFLAEGQQMKMMALEIDETLKPGSKVILGAKASNIALAKPPLGAMSISNQLSVTIEHIDHGRLLSSVKFLLGGQRLESIITLESSRRIGLRKGDTVAALIKSSEVSILEKL